jgi:arginase family enzyme
MNLNDYFDPVSLDKPEDAFRFSDAMFGRNIRVHTASTPIDEISDYSIAILGVGEDRNSGNTGSSQAPDAIRTKLYELSRINEKVRIMDLGNLKPAASVKDTYYGLRDVMIDLLNNRVIAIVLGGTQDLTQGIFMAYEQESAPVNVVTIDSRIDLEEGALHAFTWQRPMLQSPRLFTHAALGHQQYLVNKKHLQYLEEHGSDIMRLGELRSNITLAEPYLRDAHLVSLDIGAIRQSDAPATLYPSPNGLMAEEACQLARYAGMSDRVSCFGIFEINPRFDNHHQTSHLAAQAIWYFVEGHSQRKKESPSQDNADFKVFMVNHRDMEHALVFYKSLVTGRWWMEIPEMKSGKNIMVACSQEEYQQACNHDIPELWWKAFQKIN